MFYYIANALNTAWALIQQADLLNISLTIEAFFTPFFLKHYFQRTQFLETNVLHIPNIPHNQL